jgi:hypothetical protein
MGNRTRRSRFGLGGARRLQARPMLAAARRGPGPRMSTWLGWAATAAGLAVVAFFVGRAGSEVGVASPTPSPSPTAPTISFGTALDAVSGQATALTDRFRAGDPIAYSVHLAAGPGVDHILVEIIRVDANGQTVVQPQSRQGVVATSRTIAFTFAAPTSDLLTAWGPGNYVMRMYLPNAATPFATGAFTLVETPAAS